MHDHETYKILYQYDNVDFCNMTNESFLPPRMWRFSAAGDPLVDIMISRDLDSPLTQRERAAVDEWLASDTIFHGMRDHPDHNTLILAGMWGFRPELNRTLSIQIWNKLQNRTLVRKYTRDGDQPFLVNEVWPYVKKSSLFHDSFHCNQFNGNMKPFPTKRPSINGSNIFVGCIKPCTDDRYVFGECPINCRPNHHKEWIYC
ncbi:unnamed protein product [Rotaria socialis]|nr:unnamed protein product [Rotaria socialis]CAF3416631.1 unnamed protein product [Rotaria socialis]CAF4459564.1 unnamed protein product [Rotaria socialis]